MADLFRTQFCAYFILGNNFAGRIIPQELEVNIAAVFRKGCLYSQVQSWYQKPLC